MKIQKENLIMEKNKDILTKDINLIESINDIFYDIISSFKIKSLIFKNKKSKQFNKASSIRESEANVNDNEKNKNKDLNQNQNQEKQENKASQGSLFIDLDKKPEIINVSCFNQSNIKLLEKFYSTQIEKDYIKEESIKMIKKVN
jgi:hypothetical protein